MSRNASGPVADHRHGRHRLPLTAAALVAAVLTCLTPATARAQLPVLPDLPPAIQHQLWLASARQAGDYLCRAQHENGRFVYLIRPLTDQGEVKAYNWLRHCGTLYALWTLFEHTGTERYRTAAEKGTGYLLENALETLTFPDGREHLVLVSHPEFVSGNEQPVVKTGGAALAAIALFTAAEVSGRQDHRGTALQLARYLQSTVREDGRILSKYMVSDAEYSTWESAYYPGEAAMALAMAHGNGQEGALEAAVSILERLFTPWARKGEQSPGPFDHWAALALREVLRQPEGTARDWSRVLIGARNMVERELENQIRTRFPHPGSFSAQPGALCPAAIRVEGLLAYLEILVAMPPELAEALPDTAELRDRLREQIPLSLHFLRRCQYTPAEATLSRSPIEITGAFRRLLFSLSPTGDEVRIDYCQHAISALLDAHRLLQPMPQVEDSGGGDD